MVLLHSNVHRVKFHQKYDVIVLRGRQIKLCKVQDMESSFLPPPLLYFFIPRGNAHDKCNILCTVLASITSPYSTVILPRSLKLFNIFSHIFLPSQKRLYAVFVRKTKSRPSALPVIQYRKQINKS